jgi:hypothetical protein
MIRLSVLFLVALVLCPAAARGDGPGLVVHEFGVFTWGDGALHGILDEEVPPFIKEACVTSRPIKKRPDPSRPPRPVRKPLIYFHGAPATGVDLVVNFKSGRASWVFPCGDTPDPVTVEWKGLSLGTVNTHPIQDPGSSPAFQWIHQARAPKALWVNGAKQSERFAFYDGTLKGTTPIEVRVRGDRITLTNKMDTPLHDVLVVRRVGEKATTIWLADGGKGLPVDGSVEILLPDLTAIPDDFAGGMTGALAERLKGAGLHQDEASATAEMFETEFFGRDGLRVIARMPQRAYDDLLPLTMTPEPAKLVRVGLIEMIVE